MRKFLAQPFQFPAMRHRKFSQQLLTMAGEFNNNLPSILVGANAAHQFFQHQPVDQSHSTVMLQLQSLRQLSDGHPIAPGETFDGQQSLMLLRCEPGGMGRLFAEMNELPQRIAKCRQRLILHLRKRFVPRHGQYSSGSPMLNKTLNQNSTPGTSWTCSGSSRMHFRFTGPNFLKYSARMLSWLTQAKAIGPFLIVVLGVALALQAQTETRGSTGEDWPRFLGPDGNNISAETGLLERWLTNGPPLIWDKEVGSGYSAPSVQGNRLVLHHRVHDEELVQCFAAATGAPLWRYAYPSHFEDPFGYNNGPRGTPLLSSNRCYTFGAEGKLLCLELTTGKLVWERDTAKDWNVPEPFFGVGSTPLLEGERLIVMVGGQPNSGVVAFDPETGRTLWENVGKNNWNNVPTIGWRAEAPYHWSGIEKIASYSSPVAATVFGRRHVFCLTRQGLVSLNPTNGAIYFSRFFQSPINESVNAMCPVVSDNFVLFSAAYYRIGSVLLAVKSDGKSFDEIWRSPRQSLERDPSTGALVPPVLEVHWNTPVLYHGYLYAFSGRNEPDASFRCVDFKTGKLMWSRDERWQHHGALQPAVYGRGSAILADGKLIVLGEGGKLGLFHPNPERPEEICSWQVPQLHYPCWTAPVLSRKRLYLRNEERLLCFDFSRKVVP